MTYPNTIYDLDAVTQVCAERDAAENKALAKFTKACEMTNTDFYMGPGKTSLEAETEAEEARNGGLRAKIASLLILVEIHEATIQRLQGQVKESTPPEKFPMNALFHSIR